MRLVSYSYLTLFILVRTRTASVNDLQVKVLNHSVCIFIEGFGNFTYFMDMYKDASNNERVTEFPKEVGLGQKMYFGFRVESDYSDLVVFPDVCKATASSSFDSTPVHLIIEDA